MGKEKQVARAIKQSNVVLSKMKKKKLKEKQMFAEEYEVADTSSQAKEDVEVLKKQKSTESKLAKKKKKVKSLKRKIREEEHNVDDDNDNQHLDEDEHVVDGIYSGQMLGNILEKTEEQDVIDHPPEVEEANITKKIKARKVKKARKRTNSDLHMSEKESKLEDNINKVDSEKVDEILSVDEDCSRGMKKWLINYQENRPGLKILQQRIDDFMTAYEEQQEQERKEREARAAEAGWTVVVHHKGRKKTTDTESGITVGSVAQAAVMDSMAKKKNKEITLDFYRFQKREAKRNEVMMLQSKFEQDKKRMQQLRAARKFRPY